MVVLIAHSAETVVWCSSAVKLKDSFYLFNRINQKLQALKQDASIENPKRNRIYTIKYENVDILIVHISIEAHFLPHEKPAARYISTLCKLRAVDETRTRDPRLGKPFDEVLTHYHSIFYNSQNSYGRKLINNYPQILSPK